MRIEYRDSAGTDRSRLVRAIVELHRWLPERFAEFVSWRLTAIARRRIGCRIKWAQRVALDGHGTLRLRGDIEVSPGTRIRADNDLVSFGSNVFFDYNSTLLAYGSAVVVFGSNVYVGSGTYMDARGGLTIGDRTRIGPQTTIVAFEHGLTVDEPDRQLGITIGERVWIGANVVVLDGVRIGDDAVVAAGAVVRSDVAPRTVVGGVPAKLLRTIE